MNPISPSMYHITRILDDGKLHAGTDIAASLGVSRTAVWKIIQRLKGFGVEIEGQHGGYQLKKPLNLIDAEIIQRHIQHTNFKIDVFETLASTNDHLKTCASNTDPHFCIAEYQTQGRGRMGRSWVSPFGCNLYFSLSYLFSEDISELSGLSLVIGIGVVKALQALGDHIPFQLKWPNDILVDGKKLGGVLVEVIAEANGQCRAIIGIGLNVNMTATPVETPWTSLEVLLNKKIDRNLLLANLIDTQLNTIEKFRQEGLSAFISDWSSLDALAGNTIALKCAGREFQGNARGVDTLGRLLLESSTGERKAYSSGDTTIVRKSQNARREIEDRYDIAAAKNALDAAETQGYIAWKDLKKELD